MKDPAENRRQWIRFSPEISSGSVGIILSVFSSVFIAYTSLRDESMRQKGEIESMKALAAVERTQVKDGIIELKDNLKTIQKSISDLQIEVATNKSVHR